MLLAPLEVLLTKLSGLVIEHRATLVRNVTEGQFHSGEASVVPLRWRESVRGAVQRVRSR